MSTPGTAPNNDATPLRSAAHEIGRTVEGRGVLVSETGARLELNATALALLELCDGATQVEEMTQAVSDLFGLPLERARTEVGEALASMSAAGLIR